MLVDKYKIKTVKDIVGQDEAIISLRNFIRNFIYIKNSSQSKLITVFKSEAINWNLIGMIRNEMIIIEMLKSHINEL